MILTEDIKSLSHKRALFPEEPDLYMGMVHSELKSTHEYKHCYTAGKRNLAKWQVESDGLDQVTRGERQV